jgi:hypothetical protein
VQDTSTFAMASKEGRAQGGQGALLMAYSHLFVENTLEKRGVGICLGLHVQGATRMISSSTSGGRGVTNLAKHQWLAN